MNTTQTSLLWAVREGANDEAWNDFYRIYAPMLRQFGKRLGLNEAESDDTAQDVLVVVHKALREGEYDANKGQFRGWLYGVVRNRALAAHRARQRRTRVQATSDTDFDLLSGIPDTREDALREVWEQECRYALLEEALRQLQPALGEKVYLAFLGYAIEHRPPAEVAAELGIATASVYTYKNRVLKAIKEWVARFDDDDATPPPQDDDETHSHGLREAP